MHKYFALIILILFSGNPWISNSNNYDVILLISTAFLIFFDLSIRKDISIYLFCSIAVFTIYIIHGLRLNSYSPIPYVGLLIKIFLGLAAIKVIGSSFATLYVRLISLLALVSLVFFSLAYQGIIFHGIQLRSDLNSLIIYNYKFDGLRNSGFFWEPGAFAAFLSLALVFSKEHKMGAFYNVVLIFTTITTQSTTGYIFLIVYFVTLTYDLKLDNLLRGSLAVLAISISYLIYNNIPVLQSKIADQMLLVDLRSSDYSSSRFSTAVFDLHYILKHPIIGNGLSLSTRYSDHQELLHLEDIGHGMGLTNTLATYGLIGTAVFVYCIRKYFRIRQWRYLLVFCLFLLSEQLLNYPIWLALPLVLFYESSSSFNSTQSQPTH